MIDTTRIDWSKDPAGLIPAIVQDPTDGSVLMLGYMNQEALEITQAKGLVTFYSRSRQKIWTKGETSGHTLLLKSLRLDCDGDTLLIEAKPQGPTCHTGTETCWGERSSSSNLQFLNELDDTIDQRSIKRPAGSYTTQLFEGGLKKMAQKVGEEGVEVAIAALVENDEALLGEAADLVFHLMVLLRARNLHLADVTRILEQRHRR